MVYKCVTSGRCAELTNVTIPYLSATMHLLHYKAYLIVKLKMFTSKYVSKLITYALGFANNLIDVSMRMSIYPVVDAARFDVIFKFNSECAVQRTSCELRSA